MTWISHKILSASLVFTATKDASAIIPTMIGSIFPDLIEYFMPGGWRKNHRGISHWFVVYIALLIIALLVGSRILTYFFIGCILHIVQDMISGTVPLLSNNRMGVKLIRNGYIGEYLITVFVVIACSAVYFLKLS